MALDPKDLAAATAAATAEVAAVDALAPDWSPPDQARYVRAMLEDGIDELARADDAHVDYVADCVALAGQHMQDARLQLVEQRLDAVERPPVWVQSLVIDTAIMLGVELAFVIGAEVAVPALVVLAAARLQARSTRRLAGGPDLAGDAELLARLAGFPAAGVRGARRLPRRRRPAHHGQPGRRERGHRRPGAARRDRGRAGAARAGHRDLSHRHGDRGRAVPSAAGAGGGGAGVAAAALRDPGAARRGAAAQPARARALPADLAVPAGPRGGDRAARQPGGARAGHGGPALAGLAAARRRARAALRQPFRPGAARRRAGPRRHGARGQVRRRGDRAAPHRPGDHGQVRRQRHPLPRAADTDRRAGRLPLLPVRPRLLPRPSRRGAGAARLRPGPVRRGAADAAHDGARLRRHRPDRPARRPLRRPAAGHGRAQGLPPRGHRPGQQRPQGRRQQLQPDAGGRRQRPGPLRGPGGDGSADHRQRHLHRHVQPQRALLRGAYRRGAGPLEGGDVRGDPQGLLHPEAGYDQALAAARAQAQTVEEARTVTLRDDQYRAVELTELKRGCIELLTEGTGAGHPSISVAEDGTPTIVFDEADAAGMPAWRSPLANGTVADFCERAFEWSETTYEFHPYYWAGERRWARLAQATSPDPVFEAPPVPAEPTEPAAEPEPVPDETAPF